MQRNLWLPILAGIALTYTIWHVARTHQAPEVPPPPVQPARSPYAQVVAGAGIVEPKSENIQIGTELPGVVAEVAVQVGQPVRAGELLFRLDARQKQSELMVREATLSAMQTQLRRLQAMPRPEDLPPSAARVEQAAADLKSAEDQWKRVEELFGRQVATERDSVQARQTVAAARAELQRAEAEHARLTAGAWQEDLAVQQASVDQARAQVEQARIELSRLEVRAPIDGTVLKVDVRPGEYVGTPPGAALMIVGDVSTLHVRVDIDEHDLPRLRPGLPGVGYLRGNTTEPLPLRFVRIEPFAEPKRSLTGAGSERVDTRVLQVIYALEGAPATVYVGQQLDVFLDQSGQPEADSPSSEPIHAVVNAATPH